MNDELMRSLDLVSLYKKVDLDGSFALHVECCELGCFFEPMMGDQGHAHPVAAAPVVAPVAPVVETGTSTV